MLIVLNECQTYNRDEKVRDVSYINNFILPLFCFSESVGE